jgi:hypothetical protein
MLPRPRIHTNFDISGVDLVFNIAPIHKSKYGKLDHLTFPIICDLAEKDVLTLVSIYIYLYIRLKIKPNSVRIRF